ncbi:MAG: hypothetical protein COV52_05675 [Gammaproteobacteria bacterium CG11_big_fil_rev_8_21_14_0_20_46_22]|nr:MAG: hypothetical protein COW05_07985 [Gammaproteobacteria bacterium CG12_big_fil_rev_8_21_14_0_65_46_12]PIR10994.1 MAG: hypothetical protein COV52_05675 [Gammaproteobacteria bacterium CG11_big_fil_rev_8_21_14_0_20_46_22]
MPNVIRSHAKFGTFIGVSFAICLNIYFGFSCLNNDCFSNRLGFRLFDLKHPQDIFDNTPPRALGNRITFGLTLIVCSMLGCLIGTCIGASAQRRENYRLP